MNFKTAGSPVYLSFKNTGICVFSLWIILDLNFLTYKYKYVLDTVYLKTLEKMSEQAKASGSSKRKDLTLPAKVIIVTNLDNKGFDNKIQKV